MTPPHPVEDEPSATHEGIGPKCEGRDEKADGIGREVAHCQPHPGENEGQRDRDCSSNGGAGGDVLRDGSGRDADGDSRGVSRGRRFGAREEQGMGGADRLEADRACRRKLQRQPFFRRQQHRKVIRSENDCVRRGGEVVMAPLQ